MMANRIWCHEEGKVFHWPCSSVSLWTFGVIFVFAECSMKENSSTCCCHLGESLWILREVSTVLGTSISDGFPIFAKGFLTSHHFAILDAEVQFSWKRFHSKCRSLGYSLWETYYIFLAFIFNKSQIQSLVVVAAHQLLIKLSFLHDWAVKQTVCSRKQGRPPLRQHVE